MGRYNFVSPGASAGEGVLDMLSRQRQEDRQRALDEITRQNAESQRAATAQSIETSKLGMESTRQEMDIAKHNALLKDLDVATKDSEPGQDLSNLSPELLSEAKRLQLVNPSARKPTANISTSTDFQIDPNMEGPTQLQDPSWNPPVEAPPAPPPNNGNYFVGHKDDQQRERISANYGALLSDPNFKNKSPIEQMMALQKAGEETRLPAGAWTAMQPQQRRYTVDYKGNIVFKNDPEGKPLLAGPGDDPAIKLQQPYREPPAPASYQYVGTDQDTQYPVTFNNRTGKYETDYSGLRIGPRPVDHAPGSHKGRENISDAMLNALTNAQKPGPGGRAPNPAVAAQALDNILVQYNTSPRVKQAVRGVMSHEAQDTPNMDILQHLSQDFPSPEEQSAIADILTLARPGR